MTPKDPSQESWTYDRLRHRLQIVIDAIEVHKKIETPQGFLTHQFLETVGDDLREIKAGLERWYGEGVFKKKPES